MALEHFVFLFTRKTIYVEAGPQMLKRLAKANMMFWSNCIVTVRGHPQILVFSIEACKFFDGRLGLMTHDPLFQSYPSQSASSTLFASTHFLPQNLPKSSEIAGRKTVGWKHCPCKIRLGSCFHGQDLDVRTLYFQLSKSTMATIQNLSDFPSLSLAMIEKPYSLPSSPLHWPKHPVENLMAAQIRG